MFAAVLEEYGRFVWKEVNKPAPKENEALVKVEYAGICGSDQHVFLGEFHPRTPVPYIPGHEFSGVIVEKGSQVKSFSEGDRVAIDPIVWCGVCPACKIGHYPACTSLKLIGIDMDGGFSEYIAVPDSMLFKLASGVPASHAALVEVLSIGFHSCNRANVKENDTIAIYGGGKVGQCILQAARTKTSNTLFIVDILDKRLAMAKQAYPDIITINAEKENPVEVIKHFTSGKGVDIAFEAVGHAKEIAERVNPVRACIQSIRGAGLVCVLGLGDDPSPVVMKELIWKEAKIVASRVSHGEFTETIKNLEQGTLKPDALVSDILKPRQVQDAFEMLEKNPEDHLKILLDFTSVES